MPIEWKPIDEKRPPKGDVLLYYPAKTVGAYQQYTHPPMYRVDTYGSTPNRKPTHWAPVNPPEA